MTSYAQVLTQYQDQKINYAREKAIPDNQRIVSIPVEIVQKNKPPIKIEFKWRKDRKSGEWQAFDMVAEGVSFYRASSRSGVVRSAAMVCLQ
ncbi:ABC transporter [Vibrio sp. JCM 19236]|nr:ABC transporter [Vibrio sp. JCM 19236]